MRPWAAALLWSAASAALAEPSPMPEVRLEAQVVTELADQSPRQIQGSLRIRNWRSENGHCLYLPYEDGDYGEDRGTNRRFEVFAGRSNKILFEGGDLTLSSIEPIQAEATDTPAMVKLATPAGWRAEDEIVIRFTAKVPRLQSSNPGDWFYDGFLPQLMPKCLPDGLDPAYYRPSVAAHVTGRIRIPTGWEYQGPGEVQSDGTVLVDVKARTYAFALGRSFQHRRLTVGKTKVDIAFLTKGFDAIGDTVEATLPTLEAMFGPYPHPTLAIVETSELQRHGLPGIIAINKPAQQVFGHAQKEWLNWQHWITTVQLARQWYGGSVVAATPDDEWLIGGMTEFATIEALQRDPKHYDLFSPSDSGKKYLSFDYLQMAEVSAATLRRFSPFAALTDARFETRDPWAKQHALQFTKHAFALRQLKAYSGEPAFFGFLRNYTAQAMHQTVAPKDFHTYLGRLPSPFPPQTRKELARQLESWWTEEGWPDFRLDDMKTEDVPGGKYLTEITVRQDGTIDFPPTVGLEDDAGVRQVKRAVPDKDGSGWRAEFVTSNPPDEALVDPAHESFDADRFNNSSSLADVDFFPGSASTLRDDAYTIVWFPYAFRRPGEPFSLGLQSALFRYIQGGAYTRVETAPATKQAAVEVRQTFQSPRYKLTNDLTFEQNYDNDRLAELSLLRNPLFGGDPVFGAAVKARHRQRAGEPETAHETMAMTFSMKPLGRSRSCGYSLGFEIEKAPKEWSEGFTYERKFGTAVGDCYLSQRISLGVRVFAGSLYAEGEAPDSAKFKPTNLKEARLILDQRGLARATKLTSVGADLLLPFYLPLPGDSLILARQMRWRVFYNYGHAYDLDLDYRSAGFGPVLPFGGDLAGAGSLALTRLSLLVIAYSDVGGERSKKASVVFDFTGEL